MSLADILKDSIDFNSGKMQLQRVETCDVPTKFSNDNVLLRV